MITFQFNKFQYAIAIKSNVKVDKLSKRESNTEAILMGLTPLLFLTYL